jgi:trehalose 6-phosphate phosphatase
MLPLPVPNDPNGYAFLLDIDGTLLDIAPTPREVYVSHDLRETLQRLSERTMGAVAFVSGRPLREIDLLFAPLRLPAVAGHGAELRQSINASSPLRDARPLAPEVKQRFAAIAELGPGVLLEDKGYSLALHYRLAPHRAAAVLARAAEIRASIPEAAIELLPGKMVIEVKHAGFNKATGVRELMAAPPFSGRRPIFIGDDVTDWSVFSVLPALEGVGISVGTDIAGATSRLERPADVRRWLQQLSLSGTEAATTL